MQYYNLQILNLERKLPLIQVGKNTKIASFSILGDVKLCNKLADKVSEKRKKEKFDYLVGPEVKVVPLIHGIAVRLKHSKYVVCRKSIKNYMTAPIQIKPLSHFPKHTKPLVINGPDVQMLTGKKVIIIDDVVSTGVTLRMLTFLMKKINAQVVGYYIALKQGTQFDQFDNLHTFGTLPIFPVDNTK